MSAPNPFHLLDEAIDDLAEHLAGDHERDCPLARVNHKGDLWWYLDCECPIGEHLRDMSVSLARLENKYAR